MRAILASWTENDVSEDAKFATCKVMIHELAEASLQTENLIGLRSEKLKGLSWHINAMYGADDNNGKSFEQHRIWANDELTALENKWWSGFKA